MSNSDLTPALIAVFQRWYTARIGGAPRCPGCEERQWEQWQIEGGALLLSASTAPQVLSDLSDATRAVVVLTCQRCATLLFVDWRTLDRLIQAPGG